MNFLDIIIIGILIYALYDGFHKGLISEIFKIVAYIVAFVFSGKLGIFIAEKTLPYWKDSFSISLGKAISAILAFLLIFIIVNILGQIINKSTNDTLLSMPNKIFGAIFGSVKGFFIVTLIFALIRIVPIGDDFLKSNITKVDNVDDNISKTALVASGIKRAIQNPDSLKIIATVTDSLTKIAPTDSTNANNQITTNPSTEKKDGSKIGYVAYKVSCLLDPIVLNVKETIFDIDELKADTSSVDTNNPNLNPMSYINKAKKAMGAFNKSTNDTQKNLDKNK